MEGNQIKMEPPYGYFLIIRIHVKNSFPEKYNSILFDQGKSDHFEGTLTRDGKNWMISIDKLRSLPAYEVSQIRDFQISEFRKIDDDVKIEVIGKKIRRTVFKLTSNFLNSMAEIPGVSIIGVVLLGQNDTLLALEYPEISADDVSRVLVDYISDTRFNVDLLYVGNLYQSGTSPFLFFHSFAKYDFSNLNLIEIMWRMKKEEIQEEAGGIFQNEMFFISKIPDRESKKLISLIPRESTACKFKGEANIIPIGEDKCAKLAEIDLKDGRFSSFNNFINNSLDYHVYYWGYSDGNGSIKISLIVPYFQRRVFFDNFWEYIVKEDNKYQEYSIVRVENLADIISKR